MGHIELGRHARYGYDQRVEVFGSLGQAVSNNQRISAYEVWDANGEFFALKFRASEKSYCFTITAFYELVI